MVASADSHIGSSLPYLGFQAQQTYGSFRRQNAVEATRAGLFKASSAAEILPYGGYPDALGRYDSTSANGYEDIERQA